MAYQKCLNLTFAREVKRLKNEENDELDNIRMVSKVAHLYHNVGIDQVEIATRLNISQARVSRFLKLAKGAGIVKNVVITPSGLFSELEHAVESKFGIAQIHIVDGSGESEPELMQTLGEVLASAFVVLPLENKSIGFTAWSRSFRSFVSALQFSKSVKVEKIVELLGGIGQPALQHLISTSTENFAKLTNSEPVFLRVPGVVKSKEMREILTKTYSQTHRALEEFSKLDVAMVGIGSVEAKAYNAKDFNFFSDEQFDLARSKGAVAEINLRFIDAYGIPVRTQLDNLVIGITLEQLRGIPLKIGVSGGLSKHQATLAVVRGKWIDVLITDQETAQYLMNN